MRVWLGLAVLVAALFGATVAQAADGDGSVVRRLQDAGCLRAQGGPPDAAEIAAAQQECPDQAPKLRIETGTHTSEIKTIAVDEACTIAVTGSDDKSVRLWSLPKGRLLRTFRPPIDDGDGGRIYAVALSPDGRWIAAGGWDATLDKGKTAAVYLFSRDGGEVRRLGQMESDINSIAFSPDGARIAVGLGPGGGVVVFDFASGAEVEQFANYRKTVHGLAWARNGWLYTASEDGVVRAYAPDLTLRTSLKLGATPYEIAISPDQSRLAVGFSDKARIEMVSLPDLKPVGRADVAGANEDLASVAYLDNDTLLGGGMASHGSSGIFVRMWDRQGRRRGVDRTVASSTIQEMRTCGDRMAFAAADPRFGLIERSGQVSLAVNSAAIMMSNGWLDSVSISADARQVAFALDNNGGRPVVFDIIKANLSESRPLSEGFLHARVDGLKIENWDGEYHPTLNDHLLKLDEFETSQSLAIGRDRKHFYLGTEFNLRAFDATGAALLEKSLGGVVWAVDLSADDRILVAATDGGLVHWLRADDLTELLTLYVDARDKRWVMWTPTGYYMASPGGEDLIGWHINRGWSQEADFYPASAFHDRFYRPDIVRHVLDTLDEKKAIERAEAARAKATVASAPTAAPDSSEAASKVVAASTPPQAFITSPRDGDRFSGDTVTVAYRIRSASGAPIDALAVEADGRHVLTQKKLADGAEGDIELPAPKHDFDIALRPMSGGLDGPPTRIKLVYAGAKPTVLRKPNLQVIALGVDTYDNPEFERTYAHDDIDGLVGALRQQEGGFFGHVSVSELVDDHANIDEWRKAFSRLDLGDDDYLLVYIVGHGIVDADNDFWFATKAADMKHPIDTMLSEDDLFKPLTKVGGKKIVMFETCHAGKALGKSDLDVGDVFNRFKRKTTVSFFGAAQGYQLAQFDSKWQNRGAFTEAIIEGLTGQARDRDGFVTVYSLGSYVQGRVYALTNQTQQPFEAQTVNGDFPLAKVGQ